jgi:hypothetical protein
LQPTADDDGLNAWAADDRPTTRSGIVIHCACALLIGLVQPTSDELADALAVLQQVDAARMSIDAHDERLSDVVAELAAHSPVPLRADWPSLSRLGVHPDTPLTLKVNSGSGLTVMSAVAVALGDEFERPMFEAHAGGLVFTTQHGAATMRLTGVYDVRDLLADAALVSTLRDSAPMMKQDTDAPPEPEKANGRSPDEAAPADDDRPLSPGEQLIMLITDHIDPEAWTNFGGDRARVSERNGLIILTASPTVHRRLQSALELLRKASPQNLLIEASIVDVPRNAYERISRVSGASASSASIRSLPEALTLWTAAEPVAVGATLTTQSASQGTDIRVSIAPRFDAASGSLRIEVDASTDANGDQRSVKTTAALAGGSGSGGATVTAIELPSTGTPEHVRLLLLTVRPR